MESIILFSKNLMISRFVLPISLRLPYFLNFLDHTSESIDTLFTRILHSKTVRGYYASHFNIKKGCFFRLFGHQIM